MQARQSINYDARYNWPRLGCHVPKTPNAVLAREDPEEISGHAPCFWAVHHPDKV